MKSTCTASIRKDDSTITRAIQNARIEQGMDVTMYAFHVTPDLLGNFTDTHCPLSGHHLELRPTRAGHGLPKQLDSQGFGHSTRVSASWLLRWETPSAAGPSIHPRCGSHLFTEPSCKTCHAHRILRQCRRLNTTYAHIPPRGLHGNGRDTQIRPDKAQIPDRERDTIPQPLEAR